VLALALGLYAAAALLFGRGRAAVPIPHSAHFL
jgi:hypothetical protein